MNLLKVLPALRVEDGVYVCANCPCLSICPYFVFRSLVGMFSHWQGDWDRLQYYSRRVKLVCTASNGPQVHPLTYVRIAQLQSSALFPSLRRLEYNLNFMSTSNIFRFLSPLLDSLELNNIRGFENTIVGPFLAFKSASDAQEDRL